MARRRVAVLISGRGSNLQSLLDRAAQPDSSAAITVVISNEPTAFGLERARKVGIPTLVVPHRGIAGRAQFEGEVDRLLRASGIEFVCLAGFMRILSPEFVELWRDRLLNIHPSLLPAFRGLHTHARALAAGVRVHGCTVHLVRKELDDGPILVQGLVPVPPGDDEVALGARVLEVEHRCYPLALEQLASGALTIEGGQVRGAGPSLVLHPSLESL